MKGSGQLRGYAIDIISDICAYQQAKDLDTNTAEVKLRFFILPYFSVYVLGGDEALGNL